MLAKKDDISKESKVVNSNTQKQLNGLKGNITDLNGAVVSGATILLQNADKKIKFTTTSADEGDFNFSSVPSDIYTIEVISPGFKRSLI